MSVWRRKGLELFYDIRHTFTGKEDTIYTLMVQLRSRVEDAHLKKDTDWTTFTDTWSGASISGNAALTSATRRQWGSMSIW